LGGFATEAKLGIPVMRQLFLDDNINEKFRIDAGSGLARAGVDDREVAMALQKILVNEKQPLKVRAVAAIGLGQSKHGQMAANDIAKTLQKYAFGPQGEGESTLAIFALAAASELRLDNWAVELLVAILEEDDGSVNSARAFKALGQIGPEAQSF